MKSLPSPKECIQLLRDQGCSESVVKHCQAVRDLAGQIALCAKADVELVEVGSLLHDIGRGKTHGITHAIVGAGIARSLDLPSEIVNIIERHLGAGIPREEAVSLGLPDKDLIPITLEEKIVTHADNLIEDNEKVPISYEIKKAENEQKFSYAKRLRTLHDELSQICGIDLDDL
jgi:tRNA (cytidine56-2'-O)-methyltransferase